MEPIRKPFQGVWNIIRFNRHFYIPSAAVVLGLCLLNSLLASPYHSVLSGIIILITLPTLISLVVSFYIYDLSGLYKLNWLDGLTITDTPTIINIHAGFDETSALLQARYPATTLTVYDFYDPLKHTEVSIKRAREAYPAFNGTIQITTAALPLPDNYADHIFLIFAAHEIRDDAERGLFFTELKRVLKPGGKVIVLEHLRDLPNFMAYNIGFFHFMPLSLWHSTFKTAGLAITRQVKITPFITNFVLEKHGNSH
jgi:SAM-dependent methyltransferase